MHLPTNEKVYFFRGLFDSHKCFSYSNFGYTVPVSGWYVIDLGKQFLKIELIAGQVIADPRAVYFLSKD